ncbi:tryptophan biosynthesis protein TrpCF [Clostridium acetireducens DSM 10703]|jgi:indole-3-glycerol phosphate synthase|uniref:Indole-3-glycerol phosphate synthase n=1 Tax=Clostridium acetireducens DSM 10703 TaxID=1121290 RepID=A0A1E8EYR1_9CLOT|nr:indole-3-glycerol phosphate synthase TrpC [Clostridium acetireducens]OFI06086.1 tryptophan biosynthesis protein TrpCF [Clostridium acetireducens DSM 10703]
MEDFLTRILKAKRLEVKKLKENFNFERELCNLNRKSKKSFIDKLNKSNYMGIIAEIKKASPSKGLIRENLDPVVQGKLYESYGALAISVLTDREFFKGSFEYLKKVAQSTSLPILCKDFIIDEIQIQKAKICGSDVILLIVAALEEKQLYKLFNFAKQLDLEVLVEVHNEEELDRAIELGAKLVGINNRDLKTFKVNLNTSLEIAPKALKNNITLISESGIKTKAHVEKLAKSGIKGILVGESLVTATNLESKFNELKVVKEF